MSFFRSSVSFASFASAHGRGLPGLLLASALLTAAVPARRAAAQYTAPTAIRKAMLQVGGGFSIAQSDYRVYKFYGGSAYGTFDFAPHLGVEFMFHQLSAGSDQVSERTYELGPRYVWHLRYIEPYIKASYGRGVFNYPYSVANLAYNMVTGTGGVDIKVREHIVVRGEYEYQRWLGFEPNGLTPQIVTFGAAYRF